MTTTEGRILRFESASTNDGRAILIVEFETTKLYDGARTTILDRTINFIWKWFDPANPYAEHKTSQRFHVSRDKGNRIYKKLHDLQLRDEDAGVPTGEGFANACLVYARMKHEVGKRLSELELDV